MGLLDRATNLSDRKEGKSKGLLNKLKRFRQNAPAISENKSSREAPSVTYPETLSEKKARGLLERAMALHAKAVESESPARKEGLLQKAERLRRSAISQLQDEIKNRPVIENLPVANMPLSPDSIYGGHADIAGEADFENIAGFLDSDSEKMEFSEMGGHEDFGEKSDISAESIPSQMPSSSFEGSRYTVLSDEEILELPGMIGDLPESEETGEPAVLSDEEILDLPGVIENLPEIEDESGPAVSPGEEKPDLPDAKEDIFEEDYFYEQDLSAAGEDKFLEDEFPQEFVPDQSFEEETPEIEYAGNSKPESDPALDAMEEKEEKTFHSDDIFDEWLKEAEEEAEVKAVSLIQSGEDIISTPSKLLYDQESGISTEPVISRMRDQRKIEHFLSLIEISREIASVNDLETLLDNTLYSLVGEIGAESACILIPEDWSNVDSPLKPFTYSGFEPEEEWILRKGEIIYDTVHKKDEIIYADLFRSANLKKSEKDMLDSMPVIHLKPLFFSGKFRGVIMVGQSLSDEDYTLNELEFLKYLSDLTAAGIDRIVEHRERLLDREDLKKRNDMQDKIFSLAREASKLRTIDDIYDLLAGRLETDFQIDSYSLVLLSVSDHKYKIFAGNKISTESMARFALSTHSDLAGLISGTTRVHELRNFRDNSDILNNYTGDDLAMMKRYWIVPLVNMNWLVGFVTIHNVTTEWTSFQREMIVSLMEILSPVIANHLILSEKESLFRDPFSPLDEKLRSEIMRAKEFNSNVSLCILTIRNLKRILSLNKREDVAEYFAELNKFLPGFLGDSDFLSRLGQGVYALILSGRNHEECEIFITKLKAEIKRKNLFSHSPVEINFSVEIVSYPEDADSIEKMLAILD